MDPHDLVNMTYQTFSFMLKSLISVATTVTFMFTINPFIALLACLISAPEIYFSTLIDCKMEGLHSKRNQVHISMLIPVKDMTFNFYISYTHHQAEHLVNSERRKMLNHIETIKIFSREKEHSHIFDEAVVCKINKSYKTTLKT